MNKRTIIIGAGHAGGQCAISLRQAKYEGEILLIGAESHPPYERPPLSKQMLVEGIEVEKLYLRKGEYYQKNNIQLKLGVAVSAIDAGIQQVFLANGEYLDYAHLVLATGGRVRKLPIPGAELGGVHYVRTIDDATNILAEVREGMNVVVIGGGYIGLEAAASLRKRNCEVSLLEALGSLMSRSVGPEIATFYHAYHQSQGVKICLETKAVRIKGEKRVEAVECEDGSVHPADLVIIGIGIIPNTSLAQAAGLLVEEGIIVNEYCQSSDAYIYAIGDVAKHPSSLYGGRIIRLESVQNAVGQARVVAKAIVGKPIPYTEVPWFWSDQYDLKLQLAGLAEGYDHILIRGDQAEGEFAVWYLNGNQVQAVQAVNRPRDFMFGKQFIARRLELDVDKLRDTGVSLKEMRK